MTSNAKYALSMSDREIVTLITALQLAGVSESHLCESTPINQQKKKEFSREK